MHVLNLYSKFLFSVLLVGFSFFISTNHSYSASPALRLETSNNSQLIDEPFDVDVFMDTFDEPIIAVDVRIKFDPNILQVNEIQKGSIAEFKSYPALKYDNTEGLIIISANAGIGKGANFVSGQNLELARITFTAKALGASNIAFDFEKGNRNDSNLVLYDPKLELDPQDVLSEVKNLVIDIREKPSLSVVKPDVIEKTEPQGFSFQKLYEFLIGLR